MVPQAARSRPVLHLGRAPGALPAGTRVYAVGDVHGCADRLRAMHALVASDMRAAPVASATLLHLGDMIDWGPDSAGVIDLLRAPWPHPRPAPRILALLGNHEDMLLAALEPGADDPEALWLQCGGTEALASWGLAWGPGARWRAGFPPDVVAFLRGLKLTHHAGDYLFVHAGVRPGVPIAAQDRADLLAIRDPFLRSRAALPAIVVHGHTPQPRPVVRRHRIGVDTGAVYGGKLSCAVLEGATIGWLQC